MNKLFLTFMVMGVVICAKAQNDNDYYKTGDVIRLHRHTVGNGVAVVILGDGFDRNDCRKGGVYEDNCRKLTDLFLAMPVIRDFKSYFDVSARVDVSKERGVRNCVNDLSNCPDNAYGIGHPDLNWDKIGKNATKTAGKKDRSVIFMGNGGIGGAAYGDLAVYSANDPNKLYWMMHEFAGHVVAGLPDLYPGIWGDRLLDAALKSELDENHVVGDHLMLDWHSQPDSVYWKDFIGRPGYDKVGVYPSGWYGIKFGEIFTCEKHTSSVMCDYIPYFTVMERYQLWRKLQRRAGFPITSIDKFIEYDAVNLKETDPSWTPYKSLDWADDRIYSY
jgi:hypothetical protein